jgi:ABC-type taurine transport system ATPase subunit
MKRSTLLGFGIGIGCGMMRAAKADSVEGFVIAGGLTLIECMAVVGLDWFAQKRRQVASAHRISRAQIVALEEAVVAVDAQIREEISRTTSLIDEIKQREAEAFDVERVAEEAAWAVEAAYRGAINANRRLLEGGAVEALPRPRELTGIGD